VACCTCTPSGSCCYDVGLCLLRVPTYIKIPKWKGKPLVNGTEHALWIRWVFEVRSAADRWSVWSQLPWAKTPAIYTYKTDDEAFAPNIITMKKFGTWDSRNTYCRMQKVRNAYKILIARSEEKRPLWRPKRRWEDNMKMSTKKTGWKSVDWTLCLLIETVRGLL
jgi:hypothetical protein